MYDDLDNKINEVITEYQPCVRYSTSFVTC